MHHIKPLPPLPPHPYIKDKNRQQQPPSTPKKTSTLFLPVTYKGEGIPASRRARELILGSNWGIIQFPIHWGTLQAQLSTKACPNTWLPKTLTSVQLQPIIAELCPAMATYSPSNHSPQYKNLKLFLFLVLSKLIRKLVIALGWNN